MMCPCPFAAHVQDQILHAGLQMQECARALRCVYVCVCVCERERERERERESVCMCRMYIYIYKHTLSLWCCCLCPPVPLKCCCLCPPVPLKCCCLCPPVPLKCFFLCPPVPLKRFFLCPPVALVLLPLSTSPSRWPQCLTDEKFLWLLITDDPSQFGRVTKNIAKCLCEWREFDRKHR